MGTIENTHNNKINELTINSKSLKTLIADRDNLQLKIKNTINWLEKNKLEYKLDEISNKIVNANKYIERNQYLLEIIPVVKEYNSPYIQKKELKSQQEGMEQYINKTIGRQSKKLYDCYTHIIEKSINDEDYETTDETYLCEKCNNYKVLIPNESVLVCQNCGVTDNYLDNNQTSITYEQEVHTESNINHGIYKRMSHFNDILLNCQAKTHVKISDEVINNIKNEYKKYKQEHFNKKHFKSILKKLGYSKYYEQINKISELVTGTQMLQIPKEIEDKLKSMFRLIQEPFEKYKPKNRINFLSYSYCFYQLLMILNESKYTILFPLLKSREKLREQDQIWKNICYDLNWPFYPAPL